jgi:hypothetical protein
VLAIPLTVHDAAPQQTPLAQAESPLHVTEQLRPVHDAPDEHAASPEHAIVVESAFVATPPTHAEEPEQAMSQLPASQVTDPVHDDAPHLTEQLAPAQVTSPHELAAVQSTAQLLAALQSTSTSDDEGAVTEHGTPAGHLGHPSMSEHAMTHVPPLQVSPAPTQRAAHSAAALVPPPSAAPLPASAMAPSGVLVPASNLVVSPTSSSFCASGGSASGAELASGGPVDASRGAPSRSSRRAPSRPPPSAGLAPRPLAPRPHPAIHAASKTARRARGANPERYADRIQPRMPDEAHSVDPAGQRAIAGLTRPTPPFWCGRGAGERGRSAGEASDG